MSAQAAVVDLPAGLAIRLATFEDLKPIIGLFVDDEAGGHGDTLDEALAPVYEKAIARILASPNDSLYVAELSGRLVGTFQLTLIQTLVRRGWLRATVESVHVASDVRGLGIGAAMMRFAIEEARAAGAGVVQLTSNKRRVDAHRFYERLGFVRSHEGFKLEI